MSPRCTKELGHTLPVQPLHAPAEGFFVLLRIGRIGQDREYDGASVELPQQHPPGEGAQDQGR